MVVINAAPRAGGGDGGGGGGSGDGGGADGGGLGTGGDAARDTLSRLTGSETP